MVHRRENVVLANDRDRELVRRARRLVHNEMSVVAMASGTLLGPYEVTASRVGGRGAVSARATDAHSEVALKVLPELFARDPDRLRLQARSEVLASLNHPNSRPSMVRGTAGCRRL